MIVVKTDTARMTAGELRDKLVLVSTKLTGNSNFASPPISPATLTSQAAAITNKLAQITAHDLAGQALTLELRALRETGAVSITQNAGYVQTTVNQLTGTAETLAAYVVGAGYLVADAAAPVGPMPKVENLKLTQGDADGSVDSGWDAIVRGLQMFVIEATVDPAALTGWFQVGMTKKSSHTITGLTSGTRYWIRVRAMGAAGPGPWSDPATKVAP